MMTIEILKAKMEKAKLGEKVTKAAVNTKEAVRGVMPVTTKKFEKTTKDLEFTDVYTSVRLQRVEEALIANGMMEEPDHDSIFEETCETLAFISEQKKLAKEKEKEEKLEEATAKFEEKKEKVKSAAVAMASLFAPGIAFMKKDAEEKKEEQVEEKKEEKPLTAEEQVKALETALQVAREEQQTLKDEMNQMRASMQMFMKQDKKEEAPVQEEVPVEQPVEQKATRRLNTTAFSDPSKSKFDYNAGSEEA